MKQEEILDYNKLCAEFLGYGTIGIGKNMVIMFPDVKIEGAGYISNNRSIQDLHYHSDWNWIHEVVEAIEKLNMQVSIIDEECAIIDTKKAEAEENLFMIKPIAFGEGKTKKEAVVQAINQFLIWYNENN